MSRLRRSTDALLALLLVVLVVLPGGLPAAAQPVAAPTATDPVPPPNSVVEAGATEIGATVDGAPLEVHVDGRAVGTLPEGGGTVTADLGGGDHLVELHGSGAVVRSWRVHATDVEVDAPGPGLLAIALAASDRAAAGAGPPRPVLLANLSEPALALAGPPLAAATGAVLLPTAQGRVDDAVVDAAVAVAGAGGSVQVLGGLDAVGPAVVDRLTGAGLDVQRIGSGSPVDVAAAAAREIALSGLYRRDGTPRPRPVLAAPVQPIAVAMQAAAAAARWGASLVLVEDSGALGATTESVVAGADAVWVASTVGEAAATAVADAAGDDAHVERRDTLPGPAKTAWVADVAEDPATALLAARAAGSGAAALVERGAAARWVAEARPAGVTAVGGIAPAEVRAWRVDGLSAPAVTTRIDAAGPVVVQLAADRPVDGTHVHVRVGGREWPGTTSVEGTEVRWTAGPRPQLAPEVEAAAPTAVEIIVTAVVAGGGHLRHVHHAEPVVVDPFSTPSPEGFAVVGGTSAVVGPAGPVRTFSVEVQPQTGLDLQAVAVQAERALLDPARGWAARGERRLQRVADPAAADIRVVVATPATVDAFCGRVGLDTGGRLSCWDGRRAMLNLDRWQTGVSPFHTDLEVYRTYLLNHEVGHGLGYGHVSCPGPGRVAPVMMQQSKGLGGCVANGWPHP